MNTFKLQLDKNIEYSLKDLAQRLYAELNMCLEEPISKNNILFYDGCSIQLIDNQLIINSNYIYSNKYGSYISTFNSILLNQIELWTFEAWTGIEYNKRQKEN